MEQTPRKSEVREQMDSKFRYVLVVAERAEQLLRGARAKVDLGEAKSTRVAQVEVDRELVDWGYGPAPVEEAEELLEAAAEEESETEAAEDAEDASEDEEAEVH